jgi:TIR domain
MSETRISELEEIKKDPNDVHVFISYSHEDFGIAQCLQDELIAVNPDRVHCFLDAYSIRSGEEWHSKIIANLKAADWLVFLYTGRERRPYDFCGFEIGIFTSVHSLDTSRKITEAARLLCIHDTPAVPSLLSMVQNRRLRPYQSDGPLEPTLEFDFYVDSPLAQFFEDFYQYPAKMPLRRMLRRMPGVAANSGKCPTSPLKSPIASKDLL